jgi:ankyrin repeat protein
VDRTRILRLSLLLAALIALFGLVSLWVSRQPLDDALLKAARADDTALVRLLLHRGADANVMTEAHVPLAEWALMEYHPDLAAALMDAGAKVDMRFCLLHAAEQGHDQVTKLLVDRGTDPNVRDDRGRTPLILSAQAPTTGTGDPATLQFLLGHGADMNAVDSAGRTALMEAARAGDAIGMHILMQHRAPLDTADHDGGTALMLAAQAGKPSAVWVLLRAGADVHARDAAGNTALSLAEQSGSPEAVHMLKAALKGRVHPTGTPAHP